MEFRTDIDEISVGTPQVNCPKLLIWAIRRALQQPDIPPAKSFRDGVDVLHFEGERRASYGGSRVVTQVEADSLGHQFPVEVRNGCPTFPNELTVRWMAVALLRDETQDVAVETPRLAEVLCEESNREN